MDKTAVLISATLHQMRMRAVYARIAAQASHVPEHLQLRQRHALRGQLNFVVPRPAADPAPAPAPLNERQLAAQAKRERKMAKNRPVSQS